MLKTLGLSWRASSQPSSEATDSQALFRQTWVDFERNAFFDLCRTWSIRRSSSTPYFYAGYQGLGRQTCNALRKTLSSHWLSTHTLRFEDRTYTIGSNGWLPAVSADTLLVHLCASPIACLLEYSQKDAERCAQHLANSTPWARADLGHQQAETQEEYASAVTDILGHPYLSMRQDKESIKSGVFQQFINCVYDHLFGPGETAIGNVSEVLDFFDKPQNTLNPGFWIGRIYTPRRHSLYTSHEEKVVCAVQTPNELAVLEIDVDNNRAVLMPWRQWPQTQLSEDSTLVVTHYKHISIKPLATEQAPLATLCSALIDSIGSKETHPIETPKTYDSPYGGALDPEGVFLHSHPIKTIDIELSSVLAIHKCNENEPSFATFEAMLRSGQYCPALQLYPTSLSQTRLKFQVEFNGCISEIIMRWMLTACPDVGQLPLLRDVVRIMSRQLEFNYKKNIANAEDNFSEPPTDSREYSKPLPLALAYYGPLEKLAQSSTRQQAVAASLEYLSHTLGKIRLPKTQFTGIRAYVPGEDPVLSWEKEDPIGTGIALAGYKVGTDTLSLSCDLNESRLTEGVLCIIMSPSALRREVGHWVLEISHFLNENKSTENDTHTLLDNPAHLKMYRLAPGLSQQFDYYAAGLLMPETVFTKDSAPQAIEVDNQKTKSAFRCPIEVLKGWLEDLGVNIYTPHT